MSAVFPAAAAAVAFACAAVIGWDAVRRPRPERIVWLIAFLVFFVAAAAEVVGAAMGWTPALARIYYLAGAVLVVGLLALGEAYLLWPNRLPAVTPALTLLVVALAATFVWNAPIDAARLPVMGWHALERGPALVVLAVIINTGGTLVLVGGALYSAATTRLAQGWTRRTAGCVLIAVGAMLVAMGGSLTRLGRPEFLYMAMSAGIAVIFAGVLMTRAAPRAGATRAGESDAQTDVTPAALSGIKTGPPLVVDEGVRYIVERLLPLPGDDVAEACRRWSAAPITGDGLNREQARRTWVLRTALPNPAKDRFDALPLIVQAQLAELHEEIWSDGRRAERADPGAPRPLAILRPTTEAEGEAR